MLYVKIFWAFFISNILGYGGGPSIIPLIQNEVVNHYQWLTVEQFGEVMALGSALPSPIATKLAGYIGYEVGGILGAVVALIATVAPSAIAMIVLYGFLNLFRQAPQVKAMTQSVRPIIAVLLGVLAFQFFQSSVEGIGWIHTLILGCAAALLLEKFKLHPALVIAASMLYGVFII